MRELLFILLISLSSCAIFKKKNVDRSSNSESVRIEAELSRLDTRGSSTVGTSETVTIRSDQFVATIIPDGEFSFDPEGGFKGSAKSVHITGQSQSVEQRRDSVARHDTASTQEQARTKAAAKAETKSARKDKVVKKVDFTIPAIVAVLIIILIIIIKFRKWVF